MFQKLFGLSSKKRKAKEVPSSKLREADQIGTNLVITGYLNQYDDDDAPFKWMEPKQWLLISGRRRDYLRSTKCSNDDNVVNACDAPITAFLQKKERNLYHLIQFNEASSSFVKQEKNIHPTDRDDDLAELNALLGDDPVPDHDLITRRLQALTAKLSQIEDEEEELVGTMARRRPMEIQRFPVKVANIRKLENDSRDYKRTFGKIQREMKKYQKRGGDDILNINMMEKANINKKWNIVGLIDPNKHLSTLDHSLNLESLNTDLSKHEIVNYHHWIPTVFKVNKKGTECDILSDIPNLNPYQYRKRLYPMIGELFLHQLPQFETVLGQNLRDIPLKVVVKAQDYQLMDCKEEEAYLGNLHKEGLYEDISAVGLYYYHIDEDIKGGELELSSLIRVEDDMEWEGRTSLGRKKIAVSEGTSLVFNNMLCYHRVCKLHGNGSRKILAFFLLKNESQHSLDARDVVTNWRDHAKYFVTQWMREMEDDNHSSHGHKWMIEMIQDYVVGDRAYIEEAIDLYRHCRRAQGHKIKTKRSQIVSEGRRRTQLEHDYFHHACNLD